MRVDLTTEQAIQLVKDRGHIVISPPAVCRSPTCITVMVAGDGRPVPVRIHRARDGRYTTTLDACGASTDPAVAKRAWRAKKLQRQVRS
jgi:hypothetical protein